MSSNRDRKVIARKQDGKKLAARMRGYAMLIVTPLVLSACASGGNVPAASALTTGRYSMEVKTTPEVVLLAVHADGASANQARTLAAYAASWRDSGGGPITITTPANGADPAAAYRTANDARDILADNGVAAREIRIASYQPAAGQSPAVSVSYDREAAVVPRCGQSWEDLSKTGGNQPFDNFGCAVTANMAAQLAYPSDIRAPQAETPPDATRRQDVIDTYRRAGLAAVSGSVSQAVQ